MPEEKKIFVGDIDTVIEITVKEDDAVVDISFATTKDITLQRPDLTTVVKDGVFTTDGVNGKIKFVTADGDISMHGEYSVQIYTVLPAWSGYSTIGTFEVYENLG